MLKACQYVFSLRLSPCLSYSLFCPSLTPHFPPPGPYKNHISWM